MKYFLSLFICIIIASCKLSAQDCGECNSKPRISQYDLDVQVEKPSDTGRAMLEWKQLFWFAKFAQAKIFELNRNCFHFIQPLSANQDGTKTLVIDQATPILPNKNNISNRIDYLITGSIVKGSDSYLMNLELIAACSQQRIAAVSVPFRLTLDGENTMQVGYRAAMHLSPLIDKINEFAKAERESNKDVAFNNSGQASLTLKPKKNQLAAGEETEVEITLKDCDGFLLPNREIVFTKGTLSGFPINGTTGGTVTPSTVTTGNNGKAKVKFKMGTGKNAIIKAHHVFKKPSGCSAAMIGSAPIGGIPVKVEIEYVIDESDDFRPSFTLGAVKSEGGEEKSSFSRLYRAELYHYPRQHKENLVSYHPDDPEKSRTTFIYEQGYFAYLRERAEGAIKVDFFGADYREVTQKSEFELNSGVVRPAANQITFYMGNEIEAMHFFMTFNFRNEEEEHEVGTGGYPGSVSVSLNDKNTKITANKITDPQSPYKTEYLIEYSRDAGTAAAELDKELGTNFDGMLKGMGLKKFGKEFLKVKILSPY